MFVLSKTEKNNENQTDEKIYFLLIFRLTNEPHIPQATKVGNAFMNFPFNHQSFAPFSECIHLVTLDGASKGIPHPLSFASPSLALTFFNPPKWNDNKVSLIIALFSISMQTCGLLFKYHRANS